MTAAAPETPAVPGQALSPDPADFAYHVRATAFNVLTGKMSGDEWCVPRDERDAIARAVVDAVEPLIRADERDLEARQPQPAPGDEATLTVDDFYAERAERLHRTGERDAARSDLARVKRAVLGTGTHQAKIKKILAIVDAISGDEPQPADDVKPAPELAAAKPDLGTAWRLLNETREQLANVRSVCEGASAGNLANTPRGRLAKAVLSQTGPPA